MAMREAIGAASKTDVEKIKKDISNIKMVIVDEHKESKLTRKHMWINTIFIFATCLYLILTS